MTEDTSKKEVQITALWGNGDAESTISLSSEQWQDVQDGGNHVAYSESWYEGESGDVVWSFANGLVTIDGEEGRQCLKDTPIAELYVDR